MVFRRFIAAVICFAAGLAAQSHAAGAPDNASDKMWGASVSAAFMIYIVNPDRLAGWPSPLYEYESNFIPDKYKKLPVLGSWHGGGGLPDKELLVKYKMKKALVLTMSGQVPDDMSAQIKKLGMEITVLDGAFLEGYIPAFRALGKELGVPERGEELARYSEEAVIKVKAMSADIPENKKPKVFVAEGNDGLSSSCVYEILEMAGGVNAHKCVPEANSARVQLSFERIVMSDPDVILIQNPFYAPKFKDDPKWKRLRAYKEGKVYVVPYGPFGWMDKPAPVKFMAAQWLACKLYPDKCTIDLEAETKKFYRLFMHIDLAGGQLDTILYRYGK